MSNFGIKVEGTTYLFEYPQECPLCHQLVIEPSRRVSKIYEKKLEAVFQCPNPDCHRLFFGYYKLVLGEVASHTKLYPINPTHDEIPEIIRKISPSFVAIYLQANEAKQAGLDHICGPGYRKAVEFLIKDYAKSTVQEDTEKEIIDNTWAKDVLTNYIQEPKVQNVAEKALWLGNDETHYLRVWTDHDIDDLIALIKLTILWIDMDDQSKKYMEELS